ncbi:MAG: ABC transporter ATP-binding protein [Deltaproteobacteria bacterium]|nr:ABC transporter ATP-binding protein [Deltaproteobacteria bacterium]
MAEPLLEVSGLGVELASERGPVRVLDGVEIALRANQTLGIVGESGSGKTLTALAMLGLLPPGAGVISGHVKHRGGDLLRLSDRELREVRGRRIGMVFQEPQGALNPVFTIGDQLAQALRAHARATKPVDLLRQVGLAEPELRARQYPHQLSGGLRQRVMIALALAGDPEILIADEPTSALDSTVQAQLLELLRTLQQERQMAMVLITHDLALVAQHADEVAVMYAGQVVERGKPADVFGAPRHPYTEGLVRCAKGLGSQRGELPTIAGAVPAPGAWPKGCRFRERCPRADLRCADDVPRLVGEARAVACHHPLEARP